MRRPRHRRAPFFPGELLANVAVRVGSASIVVLILAVWIAAGARAALAAGLPSNPNRPSQVGAYLLQPRPIWPASLPESHPAWNCYADGDRSCGPSGTDMRYAGFSRPGWTPKCIQYSSDRRFVFRSDGSTYRAGW